jgi:hypothetical protein
MAESVSPQPDIVSAAGLPERLRALLAELTRAYTAMESLAESRQRAMSGADLNALGASVQQENQIVQRIAALDEERASIVRLVAQESRLDPATTTITQLASKLPEPWQSELTDEARRLRVLIERVQRVNAAGQLAADKLARHMQGLIQAAERWHSHAGVYGRSGAVRTGAPVVTALDCTT